MGIANKVELTRRICPVLFAMDTSGSMGANGGAPIGASNAAMEGTIPELVSMNMENPDNEIRIAILTFDSGVKVITGETELVDPAAFVWKDLNAFGGTSMGAAFRKMNDLLSVSNGIMDRASGSVAPVLFLLSDGEPTDDYKEGLRLLKENNWYKVAARVAVGYGDANDAVLEEFTGNRETILHANDPVQLKEMIRFVTITSSMVASQGKKMIDKAGEKQEDPDDTTKAVAKALKKAPAGLSTNTDPNEKW
ncbi:MAG: VWA domain-containing protein [Eubacteriales bacterium]|nr:VWA domain-containing protein [Eubacteriales bacterium]